MMKMTCNISLDSTGMHVIEDEKQINKWLTKESLRYKSARHSTY